MATYDRLHRTPAGGRGAAGHHGPKDPRASGGSEPDAPAAPSDRALIIVFRTPHEEESV